MMTERIRGIKIGEQDWLKFSDFEALPLPFPWEGAVQIDDIVVPNIEGLGKTDIWWTFENCVADCCGIDAFDFQPSEIEQAAAELAKQHVLDVPAMLLAMRQKIDALDAKTVQSRRLNDAFPKEMFSRLLTHIIKHWPEEKS